MTQTTNLSLGNEPTGVAFPSDPPSQRSFYSKAHVKMDPKCCLSILMEKCIHFELLRFCTLNGAVSMKSK